MVISNRADAQALERAAAAGVPAVCLVQRDYPDRAAHHAAIARTLREHEVDLVVTAVHDGREAGLAIARFLA